jgi:hypothetical protein
MSKHDNTPKKDRANDLPHDSQYTANTQSRRRQSQERVICALMHGEPLTRLQAARMAGLVQQANVCRYVDDWLIEGKAAVHRIGRCPVSNHDGVEFITTNPAKFPKQAPDLFTPPEALEGGSA